MKTIFLKSIVLVALTATVFTSCVKDDNYETPKLQDCTETTLKANKTLADVSFTEKITKYAFDTTDNVPDVIEAYVVSSDIGGNFFKSISFQTLDKKEAFSIPVDAASTFINYPPGTKVLINLDSLYTDIKFNGKRIGTPFANSSGGQEVGRVTETDFKNYVQASCTKVNEDELVSYTSIAEALNNNNLNKLIEIENVQFKTVTENTTYYEKTKDLGGSATNHIVVDTTGGEIIFRTSSFANFSAKKVPSQSGSIRGILTKFNNDYQFMARSENDVKLTKPRLKEKDLFPPLGGSAIVFSGTLTENFESYTAGNVTAGEKAFPKYINDPVEGGNYWYCESFNNNKYLKMSAFSSNAIYQFPINRVYFIIPIDFTKANSISFKSQDRFNVGGVLKIYYSTDYATLENVDDATLIDITPNFTIASGTTGSASKSFVDSGVYNFPTELTGNGYILFEYTGGYSYNPALTTTMHLDDISIK